MEKEKTNIEKLAARIYEEGREFLPAFLLLLEVSLSGGKHSLEESAVLVTEILSGLDHAESD